jgi:hypothetical protein
VGKGPPARGADDLTAICEPIVSKMWEPRCLTTLWTFTACYWNRFFFINKSVSDSEFTVSIMSGYHGFPQPLNVNSGLLR